MTEKRYVWAGHIVCCSKEFAEKNPNRGVIMAEVARCTCGKEPEIYMDVNLCGVQQKYSCCGHTTDDRKKWNQHVAAMELAIAWDKKRSVSYEVEKSIGEAVKKMLDAFKEEA